jgi:hypothetical protein
MEADLMVRLGFISCAASLVLSACDEDPARSVKIMARPPLSAAESARLAASSNAPLWRPELCPPPPEASKGQGTFAATGACAFEQSEQVNCVPRGDDFFIDLTRPATLGSTLRIFGNVERYKGPGKYAGSQLLVSVRTLDSVYPWNAAEPTMTVSDDERFVTVEPATLRPGFMRGAGAVEISGKFWCRTASDPQR